MLHAELPLHSPLWAMPKRRMSGALAAGSIPASRRPERS